MIKYGKSGKNLHAKGNAKDFENMPWWKQFARNDFYNYVQDNQAKRIEKSEQLKRR